MSCPALGQSQMATPMAGYSHSSIINWLPKLPQREYNFSRPMPIMPLMATWSAAHVVGDFVGKAVLKGIPPFRLRIRAM